MKKRPVMYIGVCAVVLLVLGSLSDVVGYHTVQNSQQNLLEERIDQRELVFQTIVDIANNKEIQRIILKSQMSRGICPTSEIPVLTKKQLRQMYFLGLILSKVISKARIQSMVQQYHFDNELLQKEIQDAIEKDSMLKGEITQLKDSECECENEKDINWTFPVLCTILFFIFLPLLLLSFSFVIGGVIICSIVASLGPEYSHLSLVLLISMLGIAFGLGWVPTYTAHILNCWWWRFSD